MAAYLGDYVEDGTVDFKWSTNDGAGASITRATNGTISVYKGNSLVQTTAGVTDTEDFDSLTGTHHCRIVLTDSFYVTGTDYSVVLSGAVIDGETVNAVLAYFSIENRFKEASLSAAAVNEIWNELVSESRTAGSYGASLRLQAYQGAVWLDTAATNTNTVLGVDGTPNNPVSSDAAVMTLLASTGLKQVNIIRGTFTPPSALLRTTVVGVNESMTCTVDLNSQAHAQCLFMGLIVVGSISGVAATYYRDCELGSSTVDTADLTECIVWGGLTSTWYVYCRQCFFAGSSSTSAPAEVSLYSGGVFSGLSGKVKFSITNPTGSYTFISARDNAQIELDSSFTDGTVIVQGWATLVDNTTGATVVEDRTGKTTNLDTTVSSRAVPGDAMNLTATAIDNVWDEDEADHLGVGSMGAAQSKHQIHQVWTDDPASARMEYEVALLRNDQMVVPDAAATLALSLTESGVEVFAVSGIARDTNGLFRGVVPAASFAPTKGSNLMSIVTINDDGTVYKGVTGIAVVSFT